MTTTKTKTDTSTQLPLELIDMEAYKALDTSGLQQDQREIIAIYLMVNKLGHSTQGRVNTLVDMGKPGYDKIISIASWLKTQSQDTATLKVQVNRAMTKAGTGLSLQGLGKDQTVTIAPKQVAQGGASGDSEGDTDTALVVQYDNDSFDQDSFDALFNEWDKETQQYFLKHMKAQAK
jgi:hypothetical protein